jgi:hypothetical protein
MTSRVSVVSNFVAKGHQIIPNVSCSPSKIPYGGFSPVRLQTGFQSGPSPRSDKEKCMPHLPPSHLGLYLTKVWAPAPMSPVSPGKVGGVCSPRPSRPEALGSPGSYVVSPDPRLLWPHPKLSASPTGLFASSRRAFVLPSGSNRYREAPQFTPRVSLTVPPYVPRQTKWLLSTVSSPPTLAFAFSAHSRHLLFPWLRYSHGMCNEAATFALCYGPVSCLPYTGKGFYFRAFASRGHPRAASSITIRPNSQLPEPDLHRLDTRPYGLRTEDTAKYISRRVENRRV